MPNRIQALLVTSLIASGLAGGLAGGGVLSSGAGEAEVQAKAEAEQAPLALRAQSPRMDAAERTVGRYCRPVLPESMVGKATGDRALEGQCIEDSRQRPARLST